MSASDALLAFLSYPSADALWSLREALLAGNPPHHRALQHLDAAFHFLNRLEASATAKQYSHFASLLDVGAIGGVALQNLLETPQTGDWWWRAGLGAVGESLMVVAARQYVKAWDVELRAEFAAAAWYLSGAYWELSRTLQPDVDGKDRARLVQRLIGPLRQQERTATERAALATRLFQMLLLASLVWVARES